MCESIIDAQPFQNSVYQKDFYLWYTDDSCTVNASNYAESSIRRWLNDNFYLTAFSEEQKQNILVKTINNQAYYANPEYDAPATQDPVFLLSYREAGDSKFFANNAARRGWGTEYAKSQGLSYDSYSDNRSGWWLRTPFTTKHVYVCESYENPVYYHDAVNQWYVTGVGGGVRPACYLSKIKKDASVAHYLYSSGEEKHIWNAGKTVSSPTCTTEGMNRYTCTVAGCAETYDETIAPLGHDWGDRIDDGNGGGIRFCKRNSRHAMTDDSVVHIWDAKKEITAATCIAAGVKRYTCTVEGCNLIYGKTLPVDANNHVRTVDTPASDPTAESDGYTAGVQCVDCGKYLSGHYKRIAFGSYPQTRVTDADLTARLDAAEKTWASYQYYSGTGNSADGTMTPGDFMRFADFFFEGEKYRAVVFDEYRPFETGAPRDAEHSHQDEHGYEPGTVFYFRYEPLIWLVLDAASGMIVCENLIDAQSFQNTVYQNGSDYYRDALYAGFANDYASSSLRDWLNGQFYDTAFSEEEKLSLQTEGDAVSLLSYDDLNAQNGLNALAYGTDYAKSQGLVFNENMRCPWWVQPQMVSHMQRNSLETNEFCVVPYYIFFYVYWNKRPVTSTEIGVRPVCFLREVGSSYRQSQSLYSADGHTHLWNGGALTEEATCIAPGTVTYTCVSCGETKTEQTGLAPHTPAVSSAAVPATCLAPGSTAAYACAVCGAALTPAAGLPRAGHTDGDGDGYCDLCFAPTECAVYGEVGNGVYWYLETGTLFVTGRGAAALTGDAPWEARGFDSVYIKEGVTALTGVSFSDRPAPPRVFAPADCALPGAPEAMRYVWAGQEATLSAAEAPAFDAYGILNAAYVLASDRTLTTLRFASLRLMGADGRAYSEYDILTRGKLVSRDHFRVESGVLLTDFTVSPQGYRSFNAAHAALGDRPDRHLILSIVCDDLLPPELNAGPGPFTEQIAVRFTDDPAPAGPQEPPKPAEGFIDRVRATLAMILALFKRLFKLFQK